MAFEFSFQNENVANFAFYSVICLVKLVFMGVLTSLVRVGRGVFANDEDAKAFGTDKKTPEKQKAIFGDKAVERIRRNHLNDIENIPVFIFLGVFYLLTDPSPSAALWHFRLFAVARIVHTFSYQLGLQPWRALCHFLGLGIFMSMSYSILSATW